VPTPPGRERPGEVDVEVVCGDIAVRPGDLVYGDADGVVVVPQAEHADLVARATALAAAEAVGGG